MNNDKTDDSAFHAAVQMGDWRLVSLFLYSKSVNIDAENLTGASPLHVAVGYGSSLWSSKKIFLNDKIIKVSKYRGKEPLESALFENCCVLVDKLLDAGASVNKLDSQGETALHIAVRLNRIELFEKLLKNGATVDVKNCFGETPIDIAAGRGCLKILQIELLHEAIRASNGDLVDELLDKGVDLDERNLKGETALHVAVHSNQLELVNKLLDKSADINAVNGKGETPLIMALKEFQGAIELIFVLVTRGASIDICRKTGYSVMHAAVEGYSSNLVKNLVEKGCSVDVRDVKGRTPLHLAARRNYTEMVKLLIDFGADIDAKDENGFSPLRTAVDWKSYEAINLLLCRNADIDSQCLQGSTPLHSAMERCDFDLSTKLLNCGASLNVRNVSGLSPSDALFTHGLLKPYANIRIIRNLNLKFDKILHHMLKLISAKLPVLLPELFEKFIRLLGPNKEKLISMFNQELEIIHNTKIYEGFTLGVLFSHCQKPFYIANGDLASSIQQLLDSRQLIEMFPHYKFILRSTFKESKKVYHLFYLATLSLYNFLRCCDIMLPLEIISNIIKLLDGHSKHELIKSGLYCVPSNLNQDGYLSDVLNKYLVGHYLSESDLKTLINDQLIVIPSKKTYFSG